jgi:hypothetical protein
LNYRSIRVHLDILVYLASVGLIFIWLFYKISPKNLTEYKKDFPTEYIYIPATIIYDDVKTFYWFDTLSARYKLGSSTKYYYSDRSGLKYMKRSPGSSVMLLPAFCLAHAYCFITSASTTGFGRPYYVFIKSFQLLYLLAGLWFFYRFLLEHFDKTSIYVSLTCMTFCTGLLMCLKMEEVYPTHLFFLVSVLLYYLNKYQRSASLLYALIIGVSIGLSVLIEINYGVLFILLLFWHISPKIRHIKARIFQWIHQVKFLTIILIVSGIIICCHLLYMSYLSGFAEFYNYDARKFGYILANLNNGLLGVRHGWIVYSPIVVFLFFGYLFLFKSNKRLFYSNLATVAIYFVLVNNSNISAQNNEIGNVHYIGILPLLFVPFTSFATFVKHHVNLHAVFLVLVGCCIYYNLWLLQVRYEGLFVPHLEMSTDYFYKVIGRNSITKNTVKLLDTEINYEGRLIDSVRLIKDKLQYCLGQKVQYSRRWEQAIPSSKQKMARVIVDAKTSEIDQETWKYAQLIISFYSGGFNLKNELLRVQRLMSDEEWCKVWIDAEIPKGATNIAVSIWNAENKRKICFKNIEIITYNTPTPISR